jgi:ferric-dicitrate binding protein FerR (iron transport regulator)
MKQDRSPRRILGMIALALLWWGAAAPASAQTAGCVLVADERNPPEQILRCGKSLDIRTAAGTVYHPVERRGALPRAVELDEGALMIEFHPSAALRHFQILTPNAIAAVRGTRWVVEVTPERSSTLVIRGKVAVSRRETVGNTVLLGPGDGADVAPGDEPLVVKHWAEPRVRALLARFGE